MYVLKIKVICHNNEEWYKNWRGTDLSFFKLTWGTLTRALEKICVLIASLWPKYIMFELQKYRGVIFHDTEEYANFEEKLTLGLKNDMRILTNFHQSTWKCQNWDFDPFVRSYVSWQWRIMQNIKRNWLGISKVTWGI